MKILPLAQALRERSFYQLFDDFLWYVSAHLWTSLAADTNATVAVGASGGAVGGTVILHTHGTDNNECAVATTNKPFKNLEDKPAMFETRLQYAEANTDDANVCAGFSSVMATANMLADDGAGPVTTFDGAIIYKIDGETVWRCATSRGTTQTITKSTKTAGGSTAQTLKIEVQPIDSLSVEVTFYVDDEVLRDSVNNLPIKHTMLLASAAAMQAGVYAKAGGANSEDISVDYIYAGQLR